MNANTLSLRLSEEALQTLLRLFAHLLEYPDAQTVERIRTREGVSLLQAYGAEAADALSSFYRSLENTPLPELEEIYTRTFDLNVICYPYVGYHLFGESYKRGAFLAELLRRMRAHGFRPEGELPDHLAVVLQFLALPPGEEDAVPLLEEALVPALQRMLQTFKGQNNPYRHLLRALFLLLSNLDGRIEG